MVPNPASQHSTFPGVKAFLTALKRKNIGIVYSFQNERASGDKHYDYWKFDVVGDWANAVEQLGAVPYILDTRTFAHKAMDSSLPPLDYVVNLNAGNTHFSSLGLVPSLCGFIGLPCIPNEVLATLVAESKSLSNTLGRQHGLLVPQDIEQCDIGGILRPDNFGSSHGVKRVSSLWDLGKGLYQEFIPGIDVSIPLLFEPVSSRLEMLPAIAYLPDNRDVNWFLGESEKLSHSGYTKSYVQIARAEDAGLTDLALSLGARGYCRIDTRLACSNYEEVAEAILKPISEKALYFIEINNMPTIRENVNFTGSLSHLSEGNRHRQLVTEISREISDLMDTSVVLFCALCAADIVK
mmetsp:Transcript_23982/g.43874  ORF Transcript_23982/g.43874 Transcript_23982/m.43874 type:complete len:352 (+) Transcript_23982:2060-3115(+)|eukprot:CAMPEP_0184405030 /NCGR_PEP_ID=MMETSP0738-20130409/298_1 /TAXON_ID=385413 /ORGANISM="Thalassiosira miniscula, Strain CCMP1093" /LENGTH=351 /DNA_ID=CAMNT_0026761317 /DNA_START=42 /DNA_END=1097 /DNA_ORIENTATION=-